MKNAGEGLIWTAIVAMLALILFSAVLEPIDVPQPPMDVSTIEPGFR